MKDQLSADPVKTSSHRRAAMYVRMSTHLQQYSIENQIQAIEKYARENDIKITKTYSDSGRTGLNLHDRKGLQNLIADVASRTKDFNMILVFDVSRWGRYQDVDEAAHYEFICRRSGYNLEYVAEPFRNDNTPLSNILKSIKRGMAGEYSRELSRKTFMGQARLIKMGFHQGGRPGYGFRRMLTDENKNIKFKLAPGKTKAISTDRIILVPGPVEEVRVVQAIFKAFVDEKLSMAKIAARLNTQKVPSPWKRKWYGHTIRFILCNERYIGNNVYNRHSYKLKERHEINPSEEWVRAPGVFQALIDKKYFYAAQEIFMKRKNSRPSDEEMLDKLRGLLEVNGYLSSGLVRKTKGMSLRSYARRFGGLIKAYKLINYTSTLREAVVEQRKYLKVAQREVHEYLTREVMGLGGYVDYDPALSIIIVNKEIRISVVICRYIKTKLRGNARWDLELDTKCVSDIVIAVRLDSSNKKILDYYTIPSSVIEETRLRLARDNHFCLDTYRSDSLNSFASLLKRVLTKKIEVSIEE